MTTQLERGAAPANAPERTAGGVGRFVVDKLRDYGIVLAFVVLFIVLASTSKAFLTPNNLLNLLDQSVTVGILACAATLVIIAGGFDLSMGAVFAVCAIIGAQVSNAAGVPLGILAALASGAVFGVLNGVLTTVGKLNPFVATIATTMVFRGLALAISGGFLITIADPSFKMLAQPRVFGVKVSILIFIAFALLCAFLLNRTVFGRHIFAAGGNAQAARLAGVRVNRVRATTYVIMGVAAALAGLISASRTLTVDGNTGSGIEFTALAAVLVGGTSVMGGSGAIWRTVLGVLLLQLVSNGFNLLGVEPTYQRIFMGIIIILAVLWDVWMRRSARS